MRKLLRALVCTVSMIPLSVVVAAAASQADPAAPHKVAYVSGWWNGVAMYDLETGRLVKTLHLNGYGSGPMRVSSDGKVGYVARTSGGITILDTALNREGATIRVAADDLALSPDGSRLLVTSSSQANRIVEVDTATRTAVRTIIVGTHPVAVAYSPDGSHAFVANADSNSVSVVDLSTPSVVTNVAVGAKPSAVAVTPDGATAYAVNNTDGTVSVIDTATRTVKATVPVGAGPTAVAITGDGTRALVTNGAANTVSVVDVATASVTATIPVGLTPSAIAVGPDGDRAYVTNKGSKSVSEIDPSTGSVVTLSGTSPQPSAITTAIVTPSAPILTLSAAQDSDPDPGYVRAVPSVAASWADVATYRYDWGDGTTQTADSSAWSLVHQYAHGGTVTITVTVVDASGLTATAVATATVHRVMSTIALLSDSNLRYVSAEAAGSKPLIGNRTAIGAWEQFDVVDVGDGATVLRSVINSRFLVVGSDNVLSATGDGTASGTRFQIVPGANGAFSLLALATNKYVSSNNGKQALAADRAAVGPWELFHKARVENANAFFWAEANDYLVTAESGGTKPLIANRSSTGPWEIFDVIDADGGTVALLSHADMRFVTAESAGARPLIANRTAIGSWEKFKIAIVGNDDISLIATVNGRYVTAESAGAKPLIANRTAVGLWERFRTFGIVP